MCNIRLIKKEGTSKIDDQISKFENIHINLIDMPAYIVQIFDDKIQKLEFFFSNDKEDKKEYTTNSIVLKYGINSGRIYLLETGKKEINQTDIYSIINNTATEFSTERFKDNIKQFIEICNKLL